MNNLILKIETFMNKYYYRAVFMIALYFLYRMVEGEY